LHEIRILQQKAIKMKNLGIQAELQQPEIMSWSKRDESQGKISVQKNSGCLGSSSSKFNFISCQLSFTSTQEFCAWVPLPYVMIRDKFKQSLTSFSRSIEAKTITYEI
jgi:hypothetical protein